MTIRYWIYQSKYKFECDQVVSDYFDAKVNMISVKWKFDDFVHFLLFDAKKGNNIKDKEEIYVDTKFKWYKRLNVLNGILINYIKTGYFVNQKNSSETAIT